MNLPTCKVEIPPETLDDLQERLARTRWADEISGAGWDYGSNLSYMKELIDYWQSHFDWRAQAAFTRFSSFTGAELPIHRDRALSCQGYLLKTTRPQIESDVKCLHADISSFDL